MVSRMAVNLMMGTSTTTLARRFLPETLQALESTKANANDLWLISFMAQIVIEVFKVQAVIQHMIIPCTMHPRI